MIHCLRVWPDHLWHRILAPMIHSSATWWASSGACSVLQQVMDPLLMMQATIKSILKVTQVRKHLCFENKFVLHQQTVNFIRKKYQKLSYLLLRLDFWNFFDDSEACLRYSEQNFVIVNVCWKEFCEAIIWQSIGIFWGYVRNMLMFPKKFQCFHKRLNFPNFSEIR